MKKNKLKALVKSARKTAKESLRDSITTQLKEVVTKLGIASKKVDKEISKTAKQLSKKLSSGVKVDKDALVLTVAAPVVVKTAEKTPKAVKTPTKKAEEKPVVEQPA